MTNGSKPRFEAGTYWVYSEWSEGDPERYKYANSLLVARRSDGGAELHVIAWVAPESLGLEHVGGYTTVTDAIRSKYPASTWTMRPHPEDFVPATGYTTDQDPATWMAMNHPIADVNEKGQRE